MKFLDEKKVFYECPNQMHMQDVHLITLHYLETVFLKI